MEWREKAACRDIHTNFFFPHIGSRKGRKESERAKKICAECPVQKECHEFAEGQHEEYGVWGGEDFSDERRKRINSAHKKNTGFRRTLYPVDPVPGNGMLNENIHNLDSDTRSEAS